MGIVKKEGNFILKCVECGAELKGDSDTSEFTIEDSDGERVWHEVSYNYSCEECTNYMEVVFTLIEYPTDTEEDRHEDSTGATIVESLDFWLEEEEPPAHREQRLDLN